MTQQPPVGQGVLVIEALRSHPDTLHSVRLLWTRDRPVAETTTWQHTTLTRDEPTISVSERPQTHALDRAATGTDTRNIRIIKQFKLKDEAFLVTVLLIWPSLVMGITAVSYWDVWCNINMLNCALFIEICFKTHLLHSTPKQYSPGCNYEFNSLLSRPTNALYVLLHHIQGALSFYFVKVTLHFSTNNDHVNILIYIYIYM